MSHVTVWYAKTKAAGICVCCGKRAARPQRAACEKCAESQSKSQKKRYAKLSQEARRERWKLQKRKARAASGQEIP